MSAIENVVLPMEAAGVPVEQSYDRAAALLASVGLGHRLDFPPAKLSGGSASAWPSPAPSATAPA
jgi:predicted ABC-type transport system involved in lysophospholipase L1 biosynthesis ATPase subunit